MSEETVERCAACGRALREPRFYTLTEVADLIRVSNTRQLIGMLKDKDMSVFQFGRTACLSEKGLWAFLESCRRPARTKRTIASGGEQEARRSPQTGRSTTRSTPASEEQISLFGDSAD